MKSSNNTGSSSSQNSPLGSKWNTSVQLASFLHMIKMMCVVFSSDRIVRPQQHSACPAAMQRRQQQHTDDQHQEQYYTLASCHKKKSLSNLFLFLSRFSFCPCILRRCCFFGAKQKTSAMRSVFSYTYASVALTRIEKCMQSRHVFMNIWTECS